MSFFIRIVQALCLLLAAFGLCAAAFALLILLPTWLFFTDMAFAAICALFVLVSFAVSSEEDLEDYP